MEDEGRDPMHMLCFLTDDLAKIGLNGQNEFIYCLSYGKER